MEKYNISKLFFFFLFVSVSTNSQWKATASLLTGTISKIEYVYCITQTALSQGGNTTYYQYAGTEKGIYISADFGNNWLNVQEGISKTDPSILSVCPYYQGNMFSGGYGGLYYSSSFGTRWTSVASYDNGFTVPSVTSIVINGQNILAATISSGVYRSVNNGASWTAVNSGITGSGGTLPWIYSLFLSQVVKNVYIYAATAAGVYVTADNGTNWHRLDNGIPDYAQVNSIFAKDNIVLAGTSAGLYRSANLGQSWVFVNRTLDKTFYCFTMYSDKYIFAGTSVGLFLSSDFGNNWTNVSSNINYEMIQSVAVTGSYLMAGIYQKGIWRRPLSEMVSVSPPVSAEKESIPSGFGLSQNYPNPFNPSTKIKYTIPVETPYMASPQRVTLKVYDLTGREIATLVDEEKSAGSYEINFDASHLSSGIYYYTLGSGAKSLTKKMLFLK